MRRLAWTASILWTLVVTTVLAINLRLISDSALSSMGDMTALSVVSQTFIWLIGLAGIFLAAYLFRRHMATSGEVDVSARLFEDGLQAVAVTRADGSILQVNPMFSELTGYSADEATGRNIADLEPPNESKKAPAAVWQTVRSEGSWLGERRRLRKDGESFTSLERIVVVRNAAGEPARYVFMFQDISDHKLFSSRLEQLAYYDPVTRLPNRRLLSDRIDHAVQRIRRTGGQHALLFIDLDHFKRINDTVGHAAGDLLLHLIADRLTACVRGSDTVARLGGDEFAVLLEDIARVDADRVAGKILAVLTAPVRLDERDWYIGASIGISLSPHDGDDMDSLLKNADTAMYRAKEDGRNCFRFFDPSMAEDATQQVTQEAALRQATKDQAFTLHYQPQLDMATNRIIGVEALIRWPHGDRLVPPGEFIPLAEQTGLIVPIGRWLLGRACRDIKSLQLEDLGDLKLAVNISAVELKQPDFVEQILFTLAESDFPPSRLELEITESTMLVDITRVANVLDALSATGINLAIDDFGTGYSSLSYLKLLPVHNIKIDRSFVRDIPGDLEDCTIVRAIVTMAHTLGIQVVAEGVETEAQLGFLHEADCDISQGYLVSRPIPLDDLRHLLQRKDSIPQRHVG